MWYANAEKLQPFVVSLQCWCQNLTPIARQSTQKNLVNYAKKTLDQYMAHASWYDIPPSLHRVLVHGKEIVEATPLPIGLTSEEGAESNTKFARRYHESHTRKTSQKDTMSDLFHRMMDVSDPIVVAMSPEPKSMPEKHLPPDMAELLQTLELSPSQDGYNSEPHNDSFPIGDQEEGTSDFNISICNDAEISSDTE